MELKRLASSKRTPCGSDWSVHQLQRAHWLGREYEHHTELQPCVERPRATGWAEQLLCPMEPPRWLCPCSSSEVQVHWRHVHVIRNGFTAFSPFSNQVQL
ncbi:hypothetical protein BLNAU_6690 [Blattamonas nauphoetae]|uniref:Uncharacterized protein n=1 Tax=Blattamonas nauphoetae TaxID=2049346 RepID=A0ABQ9Y3T4_9EUKA|nr:hypothetical protein BLNAU_6690 [Blattamonas nauphoetae]